MTPSAQLGSLIGIKTGDDQLLAEKMSAAIMEGLFAAKRKKPFVPPVSTDRTRVLHGLN